MRRTDTESSSTWGTPRWLGWLGWILLVGVVVLLLIDVLSEGGVTWGSAGRSLSGLTAVGVILMSRIGTRATTSEMETTGRGLRRRRIDTSGLKISANAHLIMPYHVMLDTAGEAKL